MNGLTGFLGILLAEGLLLLPAGCGEGYQPEIFVTNSFNSSNSSDGGGGKGKVLHGLFYHFEESGGAWALDSSTHAGDAKIYGATRTEGHVGKALKFGRPGAMVLMEMQSYRGKRIPLNDDQFTVDAWINLDEQGGNGRYPILAPEIGLRINDGRLELSVPVLPGHRRLLDRHGR